MTACEYKEPPHNDRESLDLPEGVPPLRSFYLYLSNSCNLSCRHCWISPRFTSGQPDPGDIIDVEALRGAITEAKPMGLTTIKLTGGEPLLHPRFREICAMATNEKMDLLMETNGTLLTAELALFLKNETSMTFVSVSIDSAVESKHDAFRGTKGAFLATLQGLDHLVAAGYENVQVIMSVHRGNSNEIEDVVRLAERHGAASVKLNPVTSCGRGAGMNQRGETLDFADRLSLDQYIFKELSPLLRSEGTAPDLILNSPLALMPISEIMRQQGATGDCGVLGILGILGSGEIAMCGIGRNVPELVYGRLGKDSIRTVWLDHPVLDKLRRVLNDVDSYPALCRECTLARRCRTGCVAQNFINGKQLVWPDPLCDSACRQGLFPATRKKRMLSGATVMSP
ncbi:MAG: radical SAM protein [Desulfobulbaceae bacterium]